MSGFPLRPGVWLGKGASVDPTAAVRGPAIIGDNCHIGADTVIGSYCVLGRQRPHRGQHHPRADGGPRQRLPRRRGPPRRLRPRALLRPPPGGALRGGGRPRRRDLRRGPGRPQVRGEGLPLQDGRGRRHRQHLDRLGIARSPQPLRPCRGSRGWPTSTSAPSWPCACPWPGPATSREGATVTTSRDTSRAARVLKRAVIVGCNAAGVNVDDLEVATVPVTRSHVRSGSSLGGHHRPPLRGRRPVGDDPVLRRGRDRRGRGHPAQDRASLPSRGVPPGPGLGDRRHRVPAPGPRALHGGHDDRRRRRGHRRRRVQARPRLLLRHLQLRHAQRPGQAGSRGPRRQPLRRHRRRGVATTAPPRPPGSPTW